MDSENNKVSHLKNCGRCSTKKLYSEFYKNRARYDGYCSCCKECDQKRPVNKEKARERSEKWRNSEKGKEYYKEHYQKNKERYYKNNKKWSEENRERLRELWRKHTKTKEWRDRHKLNQAKRRAIKYNATLPGFDYEIKKIYKNCPEGYHIDHIVPLRNELICGLHVPWNLQYLPAEENISKNNKLLEEYINV